MFEFLNFTPGREEQRDRPRRNRLGDAAEQPLARGNDVHKVRNIKSETRPFPHFFKKN